MLNLTRRPGESIFIDLADSIDPGMTMGELFSDGPVEVVILGVKDNQVRVGTQASDRLTILREENV
jgi:sRNA-binding carbon storage regulator CsrA